MSEKLDQYRPDQETFQAIRRILVDAGVPLQDIPDGWVVATIAAMSKWMSNSEMGNKFAIQLLGFDWTKGSEDKIYRVLDGYNRPSDQLNPDSVLFFYGITINGKSIPPRQMEITHKTDDTCEVCCVNTHCTKIVTDPSTSRMLRLCNHCTSFHEHPRVADQGGYRHCEACPKTACTHHPKKEKVA